MRERAIVSWALYQFRLSLVLVKVTLIRLTDGRKERIIREAMMMPMMQNYVHIARQGGCMLDNQSCLFDQLVRFSKRVQNGVDSKFSS